MTNIAHPIDHHEFIKTIFAAKSEDENVCVSRAMPKSDGDGYWFKNRLTTDRSWLKWEPDRQLQAWYVCVSTVNGEKNSKGTMIGRGRANLMRAHCLVLDDIGTKATPPPVEPSWKIETSPGNFQWGYMIKATSDFARYEALLQHSHKQGWGDAGAGGSYRLVRVPGSANIKPGRHGFRSQVTHWEH